METADEARRRRAAARKHYPGARIECGAAKPELYSALTAQQRWEAMASLCRRQWLAAGGRIEVVPRDQWPGELYTIDGPVR